MPANDRPLPALTFAVIADSHLEAEETSTNPAPRNNARNRAVVSALNQAQPAFVVHLGDVVHPVPSLPAHPSAVGASRSIFGALGPETHFTPGNHDIGDKTVLWMPAKTVSAPWLDSYANTFGGSFHSFDRSGLHFVLVNSPILNSGLAAEREQRDWLSADLKRNAGKRIFMFTHYPPYLLHPNEEAHYDNIDEPARSWLLALIDQHCVEALFCGHVHAFFYNRFRRTEIYALPSTSYVRSDYSELFRIGPGSEFGRNDVGKLGYFLVDVYESTHRIRIQRTNGATVLPAPAVGSGREVDPGEAPRGALGVHLRHSWNEVVDLPYNLQVDEFIRRRVRNDYAIQVIWELGIRRLRVPISDLRDDDVRERMRAMVSLGHEFTVFTVGTPNEEVRRLIAAHRELVGIWEVILPRSDVDSALSAVAELRQHARVTTFVAPLRSSASDLGSGPYPRYFLGHGFEPGEADLVAGLMAMPRARQAIDGLVFRIDWTDDPWLQLPATSALAAAHGVQACATVCLSPYSQRESNQDDRAIANRVAVAILASVAIGQMRVFLDTFVDMDRGFYVRNGLADRRYDLRPAGQVFRNLQARLADMPAGMRLRECSLEGGHAFYCANEDTLYALLLNARPRPSDVRGETSALLERLTGQWRAELVDLVTNEGRPFSASAMPAVHDSDPPRLLVARRSG